MNDDLKLIKLAKSNDRQALAKLLQTNYAPVYKFVLKLTLNANDAQDIVQDVMVKAIDKFHTYDPQKAAVSTWMTAIAKNVWIEHIKKDKRFYACMLACENHVQVSDRLDEFLENDQVLKALNSLNEKVRATLILRFMFDMTYEQISKRLSVPLGTVKSRISNGIEQIRKEISRDA